MGTTAHRTPGASTLPREQALLGALTQLMARWTSAELQLRFAAQHGVVLDDTKVRAIYVLGMRGGTARPSALAAELRLTRPTTSKLLARLRTDGLIDKHGDPSDGRASQVELTEIGTQVYVRLVDAGHAMVLRALDGWPDDDVDALAALLTRFIGGLIVEAGEIDPHGFAPASAGALSQAATSGPLNP